MCVLIFSISINTIVKDTQSQGRSTTRIMSHYKLSSELLGSQDQKIKAIGYNKKYGREKIFSFPWH